MSAGIDKIRLLKYKYSPTDSRRQNPSKINPFGCFHHSQLQSIKSAMADQSKIIDNPIGTVLMPSVLRSGRTDAFMFIACQHRRHARPDSYRSLSL